MYFIFLQSHFSHILNGQFEQLTLNRSIFVYSNKKNETINQTISTPRQGVFSSKNLLSRGCLVSTNVVKIFNGVSHKNKTIFNKNTTIMLIF